jgi:predicted ATPase with chaperone activity
VLDAFEKRCRHNESVSETVQVIKVARTIADLANEKTVTATHLAEALMYRPKDQEL